MSIVSVPPPSGLHEPVAPVLLWHTTLPVRSLLGFMVSSIVIDVPVTKGEPAPIASWPDPPGTSAAAQSLLCVEILNHGRFLASRPVVTKVSDVAEPGVIEPSLSDSIVASPWVTVSSTIAPIAPLLPAPLHALALIFVCVELSHVISLVFPVAEHTSPPVPSPKAVADPAAIQSKSVRAVPAAAVFQHTQRSARSVVNSMVPPAWTVGASSIGTTPIAAPTSLTRHAAVMLQRSNHDVPGSAPRRDPGTIRTDILPFRIARRALASASQRRSPPHRTRTRCALCKLSQAVAGLAKEGKTAEASIEAKQSNRSREQREGIDASAHKRRTDDEDSA